MGVRVGVTGHRSLPPATARLVTDALRAWLARRAANGVVGLTCLATGADQLFAEAVLAAGGALEVILPAHGYTGADRLLCRARSVERLPFVVPTPEAHMAAGRLLVDRCERLLAIWDGGPARGVGGTADVVAYAWARSVPVEILWPAGAWRP